MSKKLTPLEALERLTKIHNHDEFTECYNIIEIALYDLTRLQKLFNQYAEDNKRMREYIDMVDKTFVDVETTKKKLKALEIIKENLIISYDESKNDKPCLVIGIKVDKDKMVIIYQTFDKEKIDLLKEVMKND